MFALLIATNAKAQTIEKLDLVLGPPTYNNDRGDGYYYEARGNVYAKVQMQPQTKEQAFKLNQLSCTDETPEAQKTRIGTYRFGVTWGSPAEYIATVTVRLNDKRDLLWQGYVKFDPNEDGSEVSWPYEGIILHSDKAILADFTPLSKTCFGGRLTVYFLNGG